MKLDLMTGGLPLRSVQELARHARDAGFAGLVITEGGRTAYLSCAAAALAADIDILTGVAVAFPRSPMVTAQVAWELADASDGRFRLGLGTQVRAHIERRYGSAFDPPGPRMRDYLLAVRACFDAFRTGAPLDHHGPHYDLSLLPAMWSPGPIDAPDPPIDLAAVNPWMLRVAGHHADGVHIHPLNTPTYLAETVVPELAAGAAQAGREPGDLEIIVPAFVVVGNADSDRARWRELARMQVAFYGSTPNYAFIFEQLGHPGTTPALRERQKAGDLAGMAAVITDDILGHFTVEGTWATIADAITDRYSGIATRVVSYFGAIAWTEDPQELRRWGDVTGALASA
ncbi:TIGR03617 family F420-dependent LLM class oxidoreductase [Iamia sp. SCSIO 61187]|uniref:TIGR03617 family F420-dependent LLM class oxidoreductase n=1 Tax=Iamia sp. SCSIO 61187 TaxID=2722752 RepID=UPI001C62E587|nr:TIGR03617 family F420-dependent LLM class oxidoreductase [Iamia sp. SCSIO 61187]QYG94489.1 TIGR03617 family F420-dependent LLM class oxidoreductase [Iamia sp. SCSIO 61187]